MCYENITDTESLSWHEMYSKWKCPAIAINGKEIARCIEGSGDERYSEPVLWFDESVTPVDKERYTIALLSKIGDKNND